LGPSGDQPQASVGPIADPHECADLAPAERKAIVVPGNGHVLLETRENRLL
jgi:hypothetical protein